MVLESPLVFHVLIPEEVFICFINLLANIFRIFKPVYRISGTPIRFDLI